MSDTTNRPPETDRLASLLRLLDAEPDDAFCLYGVAQEHLKRGNHAEAIAWFDRTIGVDPRHAYAHYHKAKAQEGLGDDAAAVLTLLTGIEVAQGCGDAKAESELRAALDLLTP